MGEPILEPALIPTTLTGTGLTGTGLAGNPVVNADLQIAGRDGPGQALRVTCVSMGNPHCITFVDELTDDWVLGVGPKVETDPHFPRRVNAEFVQVLSRTEIRMRVWERGSGETLACGSGACAAVVAGTRLGLLRGPVRVDTHGGVLHIDWAGGDAPVRMRGPAVSVFEGEIDIPELE